MTINTSKPLVMLAAMAGMSAQSFAHTLVNNLIKQDVIVDTQEYYGLTIVEGIDDEYQMSGLAIALQQSGIEHVSRSEIEAALHLQLMGEDECPECGGKMYASDGNSRCLCGDGYSTPYEYVDDVIMTCEVCGHEEHEEQIH